MRRSPETQLRVSRSARCGWLSEGLFIHLELNMCLRGLMEWNSYLYQLCLVLDAFWPRFS